MPNRSRSRSAPNRKVRWEHWTAPASTPSHQLHAQHRSTSTAPRCGQLTLLSRTLSLIAKSFSGDQPGEVGSFGPPRPGPSVSFAIISLSLAAEPERITSFLGRARSSASFVAHQPTSDHSTKNVIRTFANRHKRRVAVETLDFILGRIAISAVYAHAIERRLDANLGGK